MTLLAYNDGVGTLAAILIFWFLISLVVGGIAESKGRSFAGWFFLALLISPVLAIIAIACVPPDAKVTQQKALRSGKAQKCPACREIVKKGATICRYCGHNFSLCKCPHCGMGFAYDVRYAGLTVKCGKCQVDFLHPII